MSNYSFSNFFKSIGSAFKPPATPLYNPLAQKPKTTVPSAPISGPMTPNIPNIQTSGDSLMSINQPPAFNTPVVPQVKPPAITPTLPPNPPVLPTISPTPTVVPASSTISQAEASAMTGLPNPSNTATPAVPNVTPATQTAYDAANKAVEDAMKISPDELSTQADIDKLIESAKAGYRATSDQPIPMEFITGQLASIERRATGLAEPLERKLARLQSARTASLEASKFKLEKTSEQLKYERESAQKAKEEAEKTRQFEVTTGLTKEQLAQNKAKADLDYKLSTEKFEEDKRQFGLDYAIKQREVAVKEKEVAIKETEKTAPTAQQQQTAAQAISAINNIISQGSSSITGIGQNPLNYLGITNAKSLNEYKQLTGLLKLGIRGLIKGQGQISDYEGKILAEASSSLGRNLNNTDFDQALRKARGVLKTNSGLTTTVKITDPSTGQSQELESDGTQIYKAVTDGLLVEYK